MYRLRTDKWLRHVNCHTYIIHGTKDPQVPFANSPRMCSAMRLAGASCEVLTVEGAGHGMGGWEKVPAFQVYKKKMVEWLNETMR